MRKYFPQGVLWCKKPEREHGARQPLPLTAAVFFCLCGCGAQSGSGGKNRRSVERGCSSVHPPLSSPPPKGGEWVVPATLPCLQQAMPRNRAAMQKTAGAPSEAVPLSTPPPKRRRIVGASNPALPPIGYAALCAMQKNRKCRRTNDLPLSLSCIHIPKNSSTIFVMLRT